MESSSKIATETSGILEARWWWLVTKIEGRFPIIKAEEAAGEGKAKLRYASLVASLKKHPMEPLANRLCEIPIISNLGSNLKSASSLFVKSQV